MKRLIIPENFVRALCKIDRRIYGYGRCPDAVEAAIGYVSGKYQFQKEAAQAHGVSRYKAHAASHVIYKSWQEHRVAVLAEFVSTTHAPSRADFRDSYFVTNELAAIAAGIDTTNGLFNPKKCDESAFKLSISLKPERLYAFDGVAVCEKSLDGERFIKKVNDEGYGSECDESQALRTSLFLVALSVGARMLEKKQIKGEKHAGDN